MREHKFKLINELNQNVGIFTLEEIGNGVCSYLDFSKITFCEYTNLKDKNGKEIFEGDILKCSDMEYLDMSDFRGIVAINDCEFFLKEKNNEPIELWSDGTNDYFTMSLIQTDECCEIIGNIYENPKLLNP